MKKASFLAFLTLFIVWLLLDLSPIDHFILPTVTAVTKALGDLLISKKTYSALAYTSFRVLFAVALSFITALLFACLAYRRQFIKDYLHPFIVTLKTVPSACILVMSLLYFGREGTVTLLAGLLVFPLFYCDFLFALEHIDRYLTADIALIKGSYLLKLYYAYLPLIADKLIDSLHYNTLLAFKAAIMAELVVQIKQGIGQAIYYGKINLLTAELLAWSLVITALMFIADFLLRKLATYLQD